MTHEEKLLEALRDIRNLSDPDPDIGGEEHPTLSAIYEEADQAIREYEHAKMCELPAR